MAGLDSLLFLEGFSTTRAHESAEGPRGRPLPLNISILSLFAY